MLICKGLEEIWDRNIEFLQYKKGYLRNQLCARGLQAFSWSQPPYSFKILSECLSTSDQISSFQHRVEVTANCVSNI